MDTSVFGNLGRFYLFSCVGG